ncbi:efflux RND transporter periplasmic adaptor subunit [Kitasatospora cathayae]|uniref:Biotin/lipoyl-binding protein n=1 Tax=Kitasatospora cathayae TaxID=3004092 RepID=A0ABY7Q513_9ACTN|nr:biotin/lipoyl-binding protein [Kitasatospora sp. HUAS 3-15]WBP87795.1 biotin/lipoyl-binding protein [Kitasatospora sp. HUAS 3-15]
MKVLPRRRGAVLVNSALGVALLGGAALVYATVNGSGGTAAAKPVARTATVAKGTVLATVSGTGTLVSPTDAAQDFTTGGRLTAVKVAVGDVVRKGQVLATVDTTAAQQQVDAARAALTTANANLAKAQAGVTTTTTEPLPGATVGAGGGGGRGAGGSSTPAPQTTTITTTKVDDAAVAQAQQQVATAQTTLSNAQAALAGTTLTASVDGTVASVSAKVGDTVGAVSSSGASASSKSTGTGAGSSTPSGFIVLTNPTGMQVTANFSELDSLKLKKGEAATVTLNAQSDTKLNATVLSVSSLPSSSGSGAAGSSAVQYAATLQLSGDTSTLRTGLSATVQVITGEADNALSLPTSALSGTGSSRTATVVHQDGSTERVEVGVGVEGDSTVQVVSGLKEGDKVELPTTSGNNGFPNASFPGLGGGGGGRNGGAVGIPGGTGGGGGGTGGGGRGGKG